MADCRKCFSVKLQRDEKWYNAKYVEKFYKQRYYKKNDVIYNEKADIIYKDAGCGMYDTTYGYDMCQAEAETKVMNSPLFQALMNENSACFWVNGTQARAGCFHSVGMNIPMRSDTYRECRVICVKS